MTSTLTQVDIRLAVTDAPLGNHPEIVLCREHADDTGSLAVYPDHLHCFGCGFRVWRRMEALAYLLGVSLQGALRVAEKYTSESLDAYRDRVTENARKDPLPRGLALAYANLLWTARAGGVRWLRERGLDEETIKRFYLGHDGTRFTLPIFDQEDRLLTLRYRRDDTYGTSYFDPGRGKEVAIPKYSGMKGRNGLYLFPEWEIAVEEPDYLVIVEGELDAVRLWQEGIPAVSTTNGAGQVHRVPGMLRERFPTLQRLFIATDKDTPGHEADRQTVIAARALGFEVTEIGWESVWGKDVTELYLNGHTLEEGYFVGDYATLS